MRRLLRAMGLRRTHVAAARMWAERNALALPPRAGAPGRARILAYHSVGTPSWGVNDVSPARFRRHLALAREAGCRFVPAEEIARTGGRPGDLAITFDDGVATVAREAAPVLAAEGIPFTVFVVTDWAEGRGRFPPGTVLGWDELRALAAQPGVTLGSHSVSHPLFALLSPADADRELRESRRVLEDRLGRPVTTFSIPMGQSRDWTAACQAAARAAGYELVYAQAEETRAPGTVGRTFVTRFDGDRVFRAALRGAFDRWEEWV